MTQSYEAASNTERRRPRIERPTSRYRYVRRRWRVLFTLIDAVGWSLLRLLRMIRGWPVATASGDPRSILVVQLDHLGDAVLSTVVLRELRSRFPTATIEVLAAPWNREIFLGCPEVDAVHVSAENRFSRGARLAWPLAVVWWGWKLRRRHYDLAIDVRGEFPLALLLWLASAKRRLGWSCGGGGFFLTHRAAYVSARHEVESRRALIGALDEHSSLETTLAAPVWEPDEKARLIIRQRLAALPQANRSLLVLHISAGTAAKRWPAENWQELLGRVAVEIGPLRIVLVGAMADREIVRAAIQQRSWPGVHDWVGQLRIAELAALVECADLFVGADSGPAHLAAAVGTPAIVLFSGTNDPRVWQPRGAQVTVLKHEVACSPCHRERCAWTDHPCLAGLRPALVVAVIKQQLSKIRPVRPAHPVELPQVSESTS